MSLKNGLLLLIILAITWQCNYSDTNAESENEKNKPGKKYMTVGYIAGYRDFDFTKIQANKLSHINYAFANIIDGKISFGTETQIDETDMDNKDIDLLNSLKKINPELKILVSVGGWTWSKNFSDVALTDSSRKIFAQSAVDFLKKFKLDGIDLDWEYPNQPGDGNIHRPEDIENFTLLLKELRVFLDYQSEVEGRQGNDKYILTIATGGDKAYIENTNLGEAHQYLDFINIMTYDAYNGLHTTTGHHANLFPADGDPAVEAKGEEVKSALTSIIGHIDAGVPVEKINLGLAFYGRFWKGVSNENNGLFQAAESVGMIEYYRILADKYIEKNGFTRFWDESAQAPYLWNPDSSIFISYEDTVSIRLKIDYLKEKGLGGVMFWEYTDDYESQLLDAIYYNLH
ncbi:MAG: glycoside hydrolase family 18 protein [Bacteroidota bacterium]|nr:glycoside hydrolase family 18 protein [Bacteroidota bacterium]